MFGSGWKAGVRASALMLVMLGGMLRLSTASAKEEQKQYEMESPEALIKIFVSQSKCFTLVDRGKGLAAAQQERALASGGELRGGSNVGKGQIKAATTSWYPTS